MHFQYKSVSSLITEFLQLRVSSMVQCLRAHSPCVPTLCALQASTDTGDGCRILQLLTASQGCCWAGSFCQLCFHTCIKGHGRALLTSAILRSLRKAHHSLFIKDGVVWLCDFTICGNAAHKERYPGKVEICAIFTWRGVTLALLLQAKAARQTEQPYSSGLASRLVSPGTLKATLLWNSTDQPL